MLSCFISTKVDGNKQLLDRKTFPQDLTISDFKMKLELITGRSAARMKITVLNEDHQPFCQLNDDFRSLASYNIRNGMIFFVEDPNYHEEEQEEKIEERFKLSSEEYAKRKGTLREFMEKNKLGVFNEGAKMELQQKKEQKKAKEGDEEHMAANIQVGDRCEMCVAKKPAHRGYVAYKGLVKFSPGTWIGVKLDEPYGKNDGSVEGVRYFEAGNNYGIFLRPSCVRVGHYPELVCAELEDDNEF